MDTNQFQPDFLNNTESGYTNIVWLLSVVIDFLVVVINVAYDNDVGKSL
jgi:hypothetical protein